jgi:hypothetical protein
MITTRRGGPYPHLRLDSAVKADQGFAVLQLVLGQGKTFSQAGTALGLSTTTAWRRYHWFLDWTLPERWGREASRLPPQRGTRACPRGRPFIAELDGPGGVFYELTKGNRR